MPEVPSRRPGLFVVEVDGAMIGTVKLDVPSMRLAAKLGFTEVKRYEEYGAEQCLAVWSPG